MTGKPIGGATYGFAESLLSGNDAATVAKDTVVGGVSGGITGGILAGAAYGNIPWPKSNREDKVGR